MTLQKDAASSQNKARTGQPIEAILTRPVRWEIVDYRGLIHGPYESLSEVLAAAESHWPDQKQDPDRTGKGWDVQVVGS